MTSDTTRKDMDCPPAAKAGMQRNVSIDILKFFACILITNSHLDVLYVKYGALATGGAIGDALFFFCSGFTLFWGGSYRFDNWYKRRIRRIYPTVFAWGILSAFVFSLKPSMDFVILSGGGWFVSCIMLYYPVLYLIRRYYSYRLWYLMVPVFAGCGIWYVLGDFPAGMSIYKGTYLKWCFFFIYMLLGAIIGKAVMKSRPGVSQPRNILMLAVAIAVFYGIQIVARQDVAIDKIQYLSLVPLGFICVYMYRMCECGLLVRLYQTRYVGWCMRLVSGLCLEVYLVQNPLISDSLNRLFPFNIPLTFIAIVAMAYVLRCLARFFLQTFSDGDYDWRAIVRA